MEPNLEKLLEPVMYEYLAYHWVYQLEHLKAMWLL